MIFDANAENFDCQSVRVIDLGTGEWLLGVTYADTDAKVLKMFPARRVNYLPIYGFKVVEAGSGETIAATHTPEEWASRPRKGLEQVSWGLHLSMEDDVDVHWLRCVDKDTGEPITYVRAFTLTGMLEVARVDDWGEGETAPPIDVHLNASYKVVSWITSERGRILAETAQCKAAAA